MDIEPVPPIVVNNHLDGVILFLTRDSLRHLESWYVTDEKYDVYDAEGRAAELRLDQSGDVTAYAVERDPTRASELRGVLLQALERRQPVAPGLEELALSDLVAVAAERLEVVPWERNGVLARAFRRIKKRGRESES
jgi:hypothetical protein